MYIADSAMCKMVIYADFSMKIQKYMWIASALYALIGIAKRIKVGPFFIGLFFVRLNVLYVQILNFSLRKCSLSA